MIYFLRFYGRSVNSLQKNNGNIIRITDIFDNFKLKDRSKIKPVGFSSMKNIYLSTSNGK